MTDQLTLRLPTEDEEQEFLNAHRATLPEVPYFLHYYSDDMPFRDYLEELADPRHGKNLKAHHVPSTFLFAFIGPRIVGRVSIRHSLNELLEKVGGHIGFMVVPEFRRRGYATEIPDDARQPGSEFPTRPRTPRDRHVYPSEFSPLARLDERRPSL